MPASSPAESPDANRALIDRLIAREGGFVDNADDRGGPTKFGITLAVLRAWRRRSGGYVPATRDEGREAIRALGKNEARLIYREMFLERHKLDRIRVAHLREHVFDAVVMHPARTAIRWLQHAAGVAPDGIVGPVTLAAVNGEDADELSRGFFKRRMAYIADLVAAHPRQLKFLRGWTRRALSFL